MSSEFITSKNRIIHTSIVTIFRKNQEKFAEKGKICYNTENNITTMLTHLEIKAAATNNGIKIFAFDGELDETNVDATFPSIIQNIGDFNGSKTLFNLEKLRYLNSKSIGYIADIAQRTEDGNGKFALCNLTPEVNDTLDLVGITSIIPVFNNQESALEELSK